MEEKDRYIVKCFNCDKEWICEVIGPIDIDWKCGECDSEEYTSIIDYEPGEEGFYERPIREGTGGTLHA